MCQREKAGNRFLNISVQQMSMMSENDYICIDTRGETAYKHGRIPGAVCWSGNYDEFKKFSEDKKLILYCTYGEKSIAIAKNLLQKGYEAYNLSGGHRQWLLQCFEELDAEEIERYDRQIILPEVGIDGQKKCSRIYQGKM